MQWSDYLAAACQDHCKDIGPKGITGHTGSDGSQPWDRMNRFGRWGGRVAENLSFGSKSGAESILQLYIDDGVSNRGHRVNILNPDLKLTGIASCNHKQYGAMLCVAYSGTFTPNTNGRAEVQRRAGSKA